MMSNRPLLAARLHPRPALLQPAPPAEPRRTISFAHGPTGRDTIGLVTGKRAHPRGAA